MPLTLSVGIWPKKSYYTFLYEFLGSSCYSLLSPFYLIKFLNKNTEQNQSCNIIEINKIKTYPSMFGVVYVMRRSSSCHTNLSLLVYVLSLACEISHIHWSHEQYCPQQILSDLDETIINY